jgi:type VI secretion system protein ImpK
MTLEELCEPFFHYVCRLNRSSRQASAVEMGTVRAQIKQLFDDMAATALPDPYLAEQYARVELALIFFVDSTIAESVLPFASAWDQQRLAYERKELAGDEKFFDLLEETVVETTDAAIERLVIFYTCLGLGFTGWFAGQPDVIQAKMRELYVRIRGAAGAAKAGGLVCPEAYENLDTRNFIERPGRKLATMGILLAIMAVVLLVSNIVIYKLSSSQLAETLEQIENSAAKTRTDEATELVDKFFEQ